MKRKYLNEHEVDSIVNNINGGINALRDRCMVMMCFIHGLRASELSHMVLKNVEMENCRIYIPRLKNGFSVQHPLQDAEVAFLRDWLSIRKKLPYADSPWLFLSRKGGRISRQQIYRLIRKYGEKACLDIASHPHMLRHACGYALAERGIDTRLIQDYLGHRNIQHTVIYTASNAERFRAIKF
ncbi:tyrosine-type recombinase/integrase [Salmonella enterica]|nr:tyrosine-type recombinase/integrase [Salmonella enterica]VEA96159.1 type 1 fimbriae regulatory protein FimB [Salmonella enterica subsp. houtenae]